jgi:hypothetical protein
MSAHIEIDLTGLTFGNLTVLSLSRIIHQGRASRIFWNCRCICGNTKEVRGDHLRSGATTSCGCVQKEAAKKASLKHGHRRTKLYNILEGLKQRCINPGNSAFQYYGEKGVTVFEGWINDFEAFYEWAYKNGYQEWLSIDRIDPKKNYCPENCRWITRSQNSKERWRTSNGKLKKE